MEEMPEKNHAYGKVHGCDGHRSKIKERLTEISAKYL